MLSTTPLWSPSESFTKASNMYQYAQWLAEKKDIPTTSYEELWRWSVENLEDFWLSIWEFYAVQTHTPFRSVLEQPENQMIGTKWFDGATLNYAEHIFRNANDRFPALVFQSERTALTEVSWATLKQEVAAVATYLRSVGVAKGDRVVNFMPNVPQAVVAFLAVHSIGAIWSSCSPDFGVSSVVDRFQQIEPKVLFAADGYVYNGKNYSKIAEIEQLQAALPSLERVVVLPYLGQDTALASIKNAILWSEVLQTPAQPLQFEPVPFDHPIWILYSSGTTGKPKAITHSVGGCLLEHLKALGLHQNCQLGERFFWYSTTGWMMWNYNLAALLHGTTMVIYDGAAAFPDLNVLWDFAENAQINHFGGGAAYYIACMKQGLDFSQTDRFPHLVSIGSTGSPLPAEAFQWIYNAVKKNIWLISLSGGTDICSGFVGGNPYNPVYAGEIQCRMLGVQLEAYNEDGNPVLHELGEMVITRPMPSMPIYFWNDPHNARYHSSYFEQYEGIWRHGDWIKINEKGGLVIYGRSDATLNRGGVRIGTSEVYAAMDSIAEVTDSLVVCLEKEGGEYFMPMFVVLKEGQTLTPDLVQKMKTTIRTQFTPRHVPDAFFQIHEVPYTISGKKMETPVKKIMMGISIEKAASKDAMKNPQALDFFVQNFGGEK